MSDSPRQFDIVVVGAGPGGIAAALTASEAGRSVALLDDNPFPGGQIWRNMGSSPRLPAPLLQLSADRRITSLRQTRIVAPLPGNRILAESPDGPVVLGYRSLILATGSRELFLPCPGWTLPGVFGAGALQALIKSGLPVKGKRVLIAGSGPLLLAVADLAHAKGARIPAILEQAPAGKVYGFGLQLLRFPGKLLQGAGIRARTIRTPYRTRSHITRIEPGPSGLVVTCKTGSSQFTVEVDWVAMGFGLVPNSELASALGCRLDPEGFVQTNDHLHTSVPGVYAIGELTGIGGQDKAMVEGAIAAHAATGHASRADALFGKLTAWRGFARGMAAAFAVSPDVKSLVAADTVICRCEDVRYSEVQGCSSARDAKLQTRCGMGPCQGRVCGAILRQVKGFEGQSVRPPVLATTISTLTAASGTSMPANAPCQSHS